MIDFEPGFLSALAGSAAVSILVAGAGGFMTDTGPWYRSMKFPSWKPRIGLSVPYGRLFLYARPWVRRRVSSGA